MKSIIRWFWRLMPQALRYKLAKIIRYNQDLIRAEYIKSKIKQNRTSKIQLKSKTVAIVGLFNSNLGHSRACELLALELSNSGIEVEKIDVCEILNAPISLENDYYIEANKKIKSDTIIITINPDLLVRTIWYLGLNNFLGKRIIGYWIWELETIPNNWKIANGIIDEIWTASIFAKDSFKKDYDIPIKIVKYQSALMDYSNFSEFDKARIRKDLNIPDNFFVAFQSFSFASSVVRKNIRGAIDAFCEAFGNENDCLLIIRYMSGDRFYSDLLELENYIKSKNSNIILVEGSDYSQLESYYAASDVYISLHRCEGFGLNIAEAMLHKVATIASNWSGNREFMTPETSILIDCELVPVEDKTGIYNFPQARWAKPNIKTVVKMLRKLRNDKDFKEKIAMAGHNRIKNILKGGDAIIALNDIE